MLQRRKMTAVVCTGVQRSNGGEVVVWRRHRRGRPAAGQVMIQQDEVCGIQVRTDENHGL